MLFCSNYTTTRPTDQWLNYSKVGGGTLLHFFPSLYHPSLSQSSPLLFPSLPTPLELGPFQLSSGSGRALQSPPVGSGWSPSRNIIILVHLSLNVRPLVATILMIFPQTGDGTSLPGGGTTTLGGGTPDTGGGTPFLLNLITETDRSQA